MDPQKLSQLDPKLRDVYTRIMGTTIPTPQAVQKPTPIDGAPPAPFINPVSDQSAQSQPTPIATQPSAPAPQAAPPPPSPTQTNPNFVQMNSTIPAAPAAATTIPTQNFTAPSPAPVQAQTQQIIAAKKSGALKPIIFFFLGLILILGYTYFWIKFFNLKLPFLP
jgi:hypothetical protein